MEQSEPLWRVPAEPEPTYEPPQSPIREDRGIFKRIGGGIVGLGLLLAKLKVLLVLLPKAKLLTTAGSMVVSLAAYAWFFGWWFGVGFVLLLFVHEMGHAIQLRREGVKAGWPVFIPGLGAYIAMKEMPKDAGAEARVGLAGPILGSIGSLVPLLLWHLTGDDIFRALAFIGFFLNLFNLVPILPLDGGRAMAAVSPVFWGVGLALIVVAAVLFPSPIILIIVVLGGFETWRRYKARNSPAMKEYLNVSRGTRLGVGVVYIGLALLLAFGIHATHFHQSFH
jgi:Zn-dependent protease